jgi:hypothetical protein
MKKALGILAAVVAACGLAACAVPHSEVRSGTQRPTIAVSGLANDATLKVDGQPMAFGQDMNDAPRDILVEEGMHKVEVEQRGVVTLRQQIYVSGGERKVLDLGGTK